MDVISFALDGNRNCPADAHCLLKVQDLMKQSPSISLMQQHGSKIVAYQVAYIIKMQGEGNKSPCTQAFKANN